MLTITERCVRSGRAFAALILTAGTLVSVVAYQVAAQTNQLDQAGYWRVVEVTGGVEILSGPNVDTATILLVSGTAIRPLYTVVTHNDGRAVLMRGADVIVVYPGSVVELPPVSGSITETIILQHDGAVYYDIDPREVPDFSTETPYLLVGVKGTQFGLTNQGALLVVVEGQVRAIDRATGQARDVGPGLSIAASGAAGGSFSVRAAEPALLAAFGDMAVYVAAMRQVWAGLLQEAENNEGLLPIGDPDDLIGDEDGAGGTAGGTIGRASNALDGAVGGVREAGGGIAGGVGEAGGGITGGIGEAVGGAADGVGEDVGGAIGGIGGVLGGL